MAKPSNPVMFDMQELGYKTPCWIWQRGKNQYGYGTKYAHPKKMLAHRWLYEMSNGPMPKGRDLDHLCRNPACVRPDHMEPVPHCVNIRRGNNTKLSEVQVSAIRSDGGSNRNLAAKYGVHRSHISRIRSEKKWKVPNAK